MSTQTCTSVATDRQPTQEAPERDDALAREYRRVVRRRVVRISILAAAVIFLALLNLCTGPSELGLDTILRGLLDPGSLSVSEKVILWDVRLPFALMAVFVGASLGLAGGEMQTVLNNPLASPSTLGVMYAATVGASVAIVFGLAGPLHLPENYVVPVFAFAGAMAATLLILFVSRAFGATVDTVILFGIAMLFTLEALVLLIQFVADSDSLQQIVFWTMGSLSRSTMEKTLIVAVTFLVCMPFAIRQMWRMTVLRGGDGYARSFGISVERLRLTVLLRVSILTAVAVSFTGVISFVGLVGPHIARLALGEDHRFYLPGSALAGAFILSGASVFSKSIVPGVLIPDGIVTALVGIPLFLALVIAQRRKNR